MSWTDLFKSKGGKAKADPRIRWFGKLPTYPDYYSSPADESWAVEFNDWVLKGYELYRGRLSGARRRGERMPISGCAIRLPKSSMTVFASVLDFGGDMRGRPFPMCFYTGVPTAYWPGPGSDGLVGASRVIRDLSALRREIPRFLNSPGRFEAVFGDRVVDFSGIGEATPDVSWLEAAKSVPLSDWFDGARDGIQAPGPEVWLGSMSAWGENLAKHESKDFEPTLRFPLAMSLPLDAQIAGWFRWLESRIDLKRRTLSLIVSGEPDDRVGYLTVIAREPVAEDFLLLTSFSTALGYLDDASQVGEATEDTEAEPPLVVAKPAGSWADFVAGAVTST